MIYKLDKDDVWKYLLKFNKTEYGKTMFIICYSLSFILFIFMIATLILDFKYPGEGFILWSSLLALLDLISFVVGSYGFYKEFRIFVNKN